MNAPHPLPGGTAITTLAEAEALAGRILESMDALERTIAEETAALKAGRLAAAMELGPAKAEQSRRYMTEARSMQANHGFLREKLPAAWHKLQQRHQAFRAVLQQNLTVLATSHAVSEGIVRGVSDALSAKAAPSVYGAGGRPVAPRPAAQPLAVSRSL